MTDKEELRRALEHLKAQAGGRETGLVLVSIEHLNTALASHPQALGEAWRPIETAPKNATDVLVRMPSDMISPKYVALVAHWADGGGDDQPRFKGWFQYDGYKGFVQLRNKPSHWMPLPAAPDPTPPTKGDPVKRRNPFGTGLATPRYTAEEMRAALQPKAPDHG